MKRGGTSRDCGCWACIYMYVYIPGKSCGSISKCGSFGRNAYLGGALAVLSCTRFPPRSLRSPLDLDPPLSLLSLASVSPRRHIRFFGEWVTRRGPGSPLFVSIIFLFHLFDRYHVRRVVRVNLYKDGKSRDREQREGATISVCFFRSQNFFRSSRGKSLLDPSFPTIFVSFRIKIEDEMKRRSAVIR